MQRSKRKADGAPLKRALYTIPEACELLGGRAKSSLYELINQGVIPTTTIGRRRYVPGCVIEAAERGEALTPGPAEPPSESPPGKRGRGRPRRHPPSGPSDDPADPPPIAPAPRR